MNAVIHTQRCFSAVMFAALSSLVWRQTCFRCIASPAPRTFSSAAALVFDRHGDPSDVLRLQELPLSELGARDVLLTVLAVRSLPPICRHGSMISIIVYLFSTLKVQLRDLLEACI